MVVANWGDLVFETSDDELFLPGDITRSASYSVDKQEVEGGKARTVKKGPGLQSMSMSTLLSQGLGINVRERIDTIFNICESGAAHPFYLNGRPVGANKWQLTSASHSETITDKSGEILQTKASLIFTEWMANGTKEDTKTSAGGSASKKTTKGFADVNVSKYEKAATPTAQEKNTVKRSAVNWSEIRRAGL